MISGSNHHHGVSAVVRVRNAAQDLDQCLSGLREQAEANRVALQIVVVDNESTDDSRLVAERYNAEILTITQREFTWGRALNRGIAHARHEIVLLISADVSPADDKWLGQMLKPLADEKVAAVYGRQLPRRDAPIDERARLAKTFPAESKRFDLGNSVPNIAGRGMILSNACAAIRRSCWEVLPYDEQLEGGEEAMWTKGHLERGMAYVYNSAANVFHSHREPPGRFAYRIWEIHQKNQYINGNKPNLVNVLYAAASIIKRRLINIVSVKAPLKPKLEGIFRLPVEVVLFVFTACYEMSGGDKVRLRRWMWG